MRKILLALTFGISTVAFGQADIAVTLNSPMANDIVGPNNPFALNFTISNPGTEDIDLLDSVLFQMSIGGNVLSINGGSIFYFDSVNIPANGGTYTYSLPPLGLNLSGAAAGAMNFCVTVSAIGQGWSGVSEASTANNQSCSNVMYQPATVGLAEGFEQASASTKLIDNSFFANGLYNVDMKNVIASTTGIAVYDLTGKEVFNAPLSVKANTINEEVSLNLNKGIYIVTIKGNESILSSKKIVVQ